jgi:hypothetical protein
VKRVLALLAILVVGAGCALGEVLQDPGDPVDLTPSTLAGTWHGGTQRFITFKEDGSFSAIDFPATPMRDFLNSIGFDATRDAVDGSGTWTLGGRPEDSSSPQATVHLVFTQIAGVSSKAGGPDLNALRPGDGKVYLVMSYVGDQGNMTTAYLKCAAECPTPSASPQAS